jgi:hypothetical protein
MVLHERLNSVSDRGARKPLRIIKFIGASMLRAWIVVELKRVIDRDWLLCFFPFICHEHTLSDIADTVASTLIFSSAFDFVGADDIDMRAALVSDIDRSIEVVVLLRSGSDVSDTVKVIEPEAPVAADATADTDKVGERKSELKAKMAPQLS